MATTTTTTDSTLVTADEWFASGQRVHFDPKRKEIALEKRKDTTIAVFRRVVLPKYSNPDAMWLTMLPGFPYGSYGYAKIETLLQSNKKLTSNDIPRLYVEYVGQGNSDKPKEGYTYNTIERADLVEAHWKAQGVKTTSLITMDFSSLVMLELLQRQKARDSKGIRYPRIENVLSVNGGYFVDGHTMGAMNTPLVRSTFGSMTSSAAQRSTMVFNKLLQSLYSKEYRKKYAKLFKQELKEMQKAIRLHQGSPIMAQIAHFADEHKTRADRWNLLSIYETYCKDQGICFHIIGSEQDPFEEDQIALVRGRMKAYTNKISTELVAGGHAIASEQAVWLLERIIDTVQKGKSPVKQPTQQLRTWTNLDATPATPETPTYTTHAWTSPRTAQMDYGLAF